MVLGNLGERVIRMPQGFVTHRLRTTALAGSLEPTMITGKNIPRTTQIKSFE